MRHVVLRSLAVAFVVGCGGLLGCSGADEHPLGGPYGGVVNNPAPATGGSGTGGSTSSGDTTGGSGSGSSSSGGSSGSGSSSSGGSSSGGSSSGSGSSSGGSSGGSSSGSSSGGSSGSGSSSGGSSSGSSSGGSSGGNAAPTWSTLVKTYLGSGTEGRCTQCHSQMATPSNAYAWLKSKGQIGGTKPALVDPNNSCLSWYGGNMPPSGPSDAKAVADFDAWAAAGASNN